MTGRQKREAKKNADKMRNYNPNTEAISREIEADGQMISDTVAEAKARGIKVAQILRERRGITI
jgi:hypothetical protein